VTIRVLICDDHEVVREGLRGLIGRQAGMTVVGEAGTVAAFETAEDEPAEGWTTGVAGGDTRFQVFARLHSTGRHVGVTLKADLDDVVADLGRRWEVLDVKFKIYPTPGFNQPVVWLASEMVAKHRLDADLIEHATLEMNYLETLYPSPKFPRRPAPDGSGFGRTDYMLAYTLISGDYPVLERNVEDPRDAGASTSAGIAAPSCR